PSHPYHSVTGTLDADQTVRSAHFTHPAYIRFVRRISLGGQGFDCPCPWQLYVANSANGGDTWIRLKIVDLPKTVDPAQIFVQMAIDRAGNLYYNWSQARNVTSSGEGEQDIYYTFSTDRGAHWAAPIDLT